MFSFFGKNKKKAPTQENVRNDSDDTSSSEAPITRASKRGAKDAGQMVVTPRTRADEKSEHREMSKRQSPEDIFMKDPRTTDIVILILGPIGAGKSTFINTVAGAAVTAVGHSLNLETKNLCPIILPKYSKHNRRIILVDTPGFDDTNFSDIGILRRVSIWLNRSYAGSTKFAGVIYLHEISQARFIGTPPQKNLKSLNKLCGTVATENIILATTKWSDVPEDVGERREIELKDDLWKDMLNLGSTLCRFKRTPETGWKILNHIINHASVDVVNFQAQEANQRAQYPNHSEGEVHGKGWRELPKTTPAFRRLFF